MTTPTVLPPALRTVGLTKHYGDVPALVDLDLEVHRGEVFGFLGPNGAGKTTMIRTVLDELRPTAGRAEVLGLDSHADSVEIRRHVGYLPGDLALYPSLTGRDTLRLFANLRGKKGLRGGVDWSYVDELVARLGADLDRPVGELSSGNRQKVGLVQAFMHHPDLLVMDEPSAGLDPLVQREFQAMVREVAASGRAVFLSSHTLGEVQRVADRVGIIRRGRLVAVEAVAELRAKAVRRVELRFATAPTATLVEDVEGARDAVVDGTSLVLSLDGPVGPLLAAVAHGPELLDVSTHEADLEEVFLTYYREEVGAPAPEAEQVGAR